MIKVYSVKKCRSCKKSIEWLKLHQLEFEEIDIKKGKIRQENFMKLFSLSDYGALDFISTRCKAYNKLNKNLNELHLTEFIDLVNDNRGVLRHPIILSDTCIQIGYSAEQIRCFVFKDERRVQLQR